MYVVCRFFSGIINHSRRYAVLLGLVMAVFCGHAQKSAAPALPWWKQNNLRVIQTNLPDYEAATLDADSLVKDLQDFSANVLLINAGGIMAFYPTKLDFQYTNPYMKPHTLGDIIRKCHGRGIHVIVRFDFSRVQESIFKAHPDWCYISPKGERIINSDMYVVSINGPYVQDRAFRIVQEVMDDYPIDGIFLNMPGYQVNNPYEGKYEGIDRNEYDKKRFFEYSKGKALPVEENKADPLFQEYTAFKEATVSAWSKRLSELVKAKSDQIAICTYSDKYVDIIRQESQNMLTLPYWPYMASDNVNNATHSYPHHIISNSSIQQLSFQSRYNAIEPEEAAIRLYENIANGSGLDISLMGDLRGYEDERNFDVIKKIYAFQSMQNAYFGNYRSVAEIAVVAPGPWPAGSSMQEYRGIFAMLKEAHIPFDVIEDAQLAAREDDLTKYRLLILPDITYLNPACVGVLERVSDAGTNLIATNTTLFDNPEALKELFGAAIVKKDNDGRGNYLSPDNQYGLFRRLVKQKMISWTFNLGLDDFKGADSVYLPILSKGRPGPPEIIGGHESTGYYAMGMKRHGQAKAVLLPVNIGKEYYMRGYEQYKNILLDVIDDVLADAGQWIQTNAPPRVETILQEYSRNTPENIGLKGLDGLILHLVNLTGFSGVTYFKPLPVSDLSFRVKCNFKPRAVFCLSDGQAVPFSWADGMVEFRLRRLESYEGVVINKL
jgi:hypothetical protein